MKTIIFQSLDRKVRVVRDNFWFRVEHKSGLTFRDGGSSRSAEVAVSMALYLINL